MVNIPKITVEDLAEDAIEKLSCCLVLDTSESMTYNNAIEEVNKAVKLYFKAINNNDRTKEVVETSIVTFGNKEFSKEIPEDDRNPKNGVKVLLDYWDKNDGEIPTLETYPGGFTSMGEAVDKGLELVLKRKNDYKENVGSYKQPWIIIMTDGKPYDYFSTEGRCDSVLEISKKTEKLVNDKKLNVILVVVGEDVDVDILRKFSPKRWFKGKLIKNNPVKVNNLKFDKFFVFLSQSLANPDDGFILGDEEDLEELI